MKKLISFIIPHKGREQYLIQTLDSIAKQDFDLAQIKVMVVTQNQSLSDDSTAFRENFDLEVLYRPQSDTISALRNFGVTCTDSEFLAFLDADIYLSPNWCRSMLQEIQAIPDCVLVSAAQRNSSSATSLEQIRVALSNAVLDHEVDFLPGRNLFLKRSTFDQVGGFPEHLITCEDYYFTDQVHKLGALYYTSAADYIHLGEDKTYMEMYKKEIWRGQSNLQSIQGRKIPLREIPSFLSPIGIVLFFILSIVALLLNKSIVFYLLLGLSVIPFSFYAFRLYAIAKKEIKFRYILKFYLYYFPARAIGTLGGLFNTIKTDTHN